MEEKFDNVLNSINSDNMLNTTKHHDTVLNGEFYFNVMLHVFILFTILHLFFKFYICKITTSAISNEFKHIIEDVFKNIDKEKFAKNIDNYKNSVSSFTKLFENKEELDKKLSVLSFLKDNYNVNTIDDLLNIISNKSEENITSSKKAIDIDPKKIEMLKAGKSPIY